MWVQDAGKKLVSAMLGLQSTRAATQPRPFLKLSRQHLAVQVFTLSCQGYCQTKREQSKHDSLCSTLPASEDLFLEC